MSHVRIAVPTKAIGVAVLRAAHDVARDGRAGNVPAEAARWIAANDAQFRALVADVRREEIPTGRYRRPAGNPRTHLGGRLICPGCQEPARRGVIRREGWALGVESARLQHTHLDGEPLCPVMTAQGYQPALPIRENPLTRQEQARALTTARLQERFARSKNLLPGGREFHLGQAAGITLTAMQFAEQERRDSLQRGDVLARHYVGLGQQAFGKGIGSAQAARNPLTGPTRMDIQNYFDALLRINTPISVALRQTERAFGLGNITISRSGQVVGFSNPMKKGAHSRARRHPGVAAHRRLGRERAALAPFGTGEPDDTVYTPPPLGMTPEEFEYEVGYGYDYPTFQKDAVRDALRARRYDLNPSGCKRCKGARQVQLGRNTVKCPTCCRKNPLDHNESEQLLGYAKTQTKLARTPTMSYDGRLESAATAYEDASIVKEFGKSSGLYGAAAHAQTVARQARDEVKRSAPKRNPLASHKPGCRCIFHTGRMGHNSVRKLGR